MPALKWQRPQTLFPEPSAQPTAHPASHSKARLWKEDNCQHFRQDCDQEKKNGKQHSRDLVHLLPYKGQLKKQPEPRGGHEGLPVTTEKK